MTQLSIANWSAWAPGLKDREDWQTPRSPDTYLDALKGHEAPDVEWVPSRKRRRCSTLTRIALHVGFDCCNVHGVDPGEIKSAFSTRHGELTRNTDLLKTLSNDELLSPMAFGNSVHNTPSSYFCMCADNHHASRTVSACDATFQNGLLDAITLLDIAPDLPVLYVCVHVTPPEPFDRYDPFENSCWGVALLLTGSSGTFDLEMNRAPNERTEGLTLPPSIAFLNWLLHGDSQRIQLADTNESHAWSWNVTGDARQDERL